MHGADDGHRKCERCSFRAECPTCPLGPLDPANSGAPADVPFTGAGGAGTVGAVGSAIAEPDDPIISGDDHSAAGPGVCVGDAVSSDHTTIDHASRPEHTSSAGLAPGLAAVLLSCALPTTPPAAAAAHATSSSDLMSVDPPATGPLDPLLPSSAAVHPSTQAAAEHCPSPLASARLLNALSDTPQPEGAEPARAPSAAGAAGSLKRKASSLDHVSDIDAGRPVAHRSIPHIQFQPQLERDGVSDQQAALNHVEQRTASAGASCAAMEGVLVDLSAANTACAGSISPSSASTSAAAAAEPIVATLQSPLSLIGNAVNSSSSSSSSSSARWRRAISIRAGAGSPPSH